MEQHQSSTGVRTITTLVVCPLCHRTVTPDRFERLVCRCGWSGSGDPLEGTHGLTRLITGLDRRIANGLAVRELERVKTGRIFRPLNSFYRLVLLIYSTVVYLVVFALLAGSILLTVNCALSGAWLGVGLGLFLILVLVYALSHGRVSVQGITAGRDRFPDLFAALDEVASRTGSRLPHRVVLIPEGSFFVYQSHTIRRFFFPERVLAIGVASLSLLSVEEVKAILAHELAHFRNLDTSLHRYYSLADSALLYILQVVREAIADTAPGALRGRRYRSRIVGDPGTVAFLILLPLYWLLLLPVRIFWVGFRLLRLAESRRAEFLSDRLAVQSYGAQPLVGGLTVVTATLVRQARPHDYIVDDMHRLKTSNYYSVQRRNYAELPEEYRRQVNSEAMHDFPTLESTHPTMGDRIIAARMQDPGNIASSVTTPSATHLITPKGEASADAVEVELSQMLLSYRFAKRRRR